MAAVDFQDPPWICRGGGGDNVRHMRATEKEAGVSHSRQILAPTFPLLGNLQNCSVHSGNGERRLHEGGVCSRIGRKAGEGCRDLGFCQIASWSAHSQFALTLHLYLHLYLHLHLCLYLCLNKSFCRSLGVVPGSQLEDLLNLSPAS